MSCWYSLGSGLPSLYGVLWKEENKRWWVEWELVYISDLVENEGPS